MRDRSIKLTVCFESRPDGGLRAWSEDVPGLVLSHPNVDDVLEDVTEALKTILSHQFNAPVDVKPLVNMREMLEDQGIIPRKGSIPRSQEYVAYCQ